MNRNKFTEDYFKCIFFGILIIEIWMKVIPKDPID